MSTQPTLGGVRPEDQPAAINDQSVRAALARRDLPWWTRIGRWQRIGLVILEFALIGLIWEVAIGTLEIVNPLFLPPPSQMLTGLVDLFATGEIYSHLKISAYAWVVGYGLAAIVGILSGFLMGSSKLFAKLGGPFIWLIYAAPWIAFQPLFAVWFGFGVLPVIFIVFTAAVFPIIFNTAVGVQTVPTSMLRCAAVYGASTVRRFQTVVAPAVFPFILVGLRHAVVSATGGLIVGELTSTTEGLGALVAIKTAQFQVGAAYSVIILAVLFTIIVGRSLAMLARRVAPWHFSEERS